MPDLTPEQVDAAFEREEREAARMAESDAECNEPGVGFVGCSAAGRVLRVRVANRNRQRMRVECPHGCGIHDASHSMARPLRDDEAEPELVELPPEERPAPTRADPTRAAKRPAPKSDAAVIAAIPAEWTPAADLAADLGYASRKSFRNRLREMRKRAEAKGEPPPFQSDSSVTGLKVRAA